MLIAAKWCVALALWALSVILLLAGACALFDSDQPMDRRASGLVLSPVGLLLFGVGCWVLS